MSAFFSSGDSAGVVTRSKARAISATSNVTSIPTQAKAKDVNRRREPVINLASLGAKKTIALVDERNSRIEEKSFSGLKNSRERSLSPVSGANSSTGSYHGSLPDDQQKKIASASVDKEPTQDVHKKESHHEAESSEKLLGHEIESGDKSHGKSDTTLVGSLSIQQLQDMITNTIRAQYGEPSQDTFIYSKPYTKSWEQMEREFLNRFHSTRRSVSMLELTSTKQRKDEPVVVYKNRWRSLSLDCKDQVSELSAVEMCIQGMHWGLLYILQGIKPHSFEELTTRAHDIELSIASHD
ncbi:hypothetical protein L3X38_003223 [Prunus dulcis]|uniref:Retrotransposon gag domain-containing protein n=1 Tax=Prunus dulcis TaxID=3755 RepID=A0AAD4ZLM7_PRUDU|nr:hypothetical protein L3X38_003223 [Prunus dulcis]